MREKRKIVGLLIFALICFLLSATVIYSASQSMLLGAKALSVYRATITGLRISAVDGGGTASGGSFLDNCAALVPYADGKHKVEIYSGTFMAAAYIKAAGSGETLDVNLHTNADFASDEPPGTAWDKGAGITITGGKLTFALTSSQVAWQTFSLPVGGLYKWGFDLSSYVSGTGMNYYFATIEIGQIQTVPASYSGYRTSALGSATYYGMSGRGTLNGTGDNVYLQKVLTPSADGVTLVSAREGDQYNFTYKHASFPYNQASYTVIVKKVR